MVIFLKIQRHIAMIYLPSLSFTGSIFKLSLSNKSIVIVFHRDFSSRRMAKSRGSVLRIPDSDRLVTSLDLFEIFHDGIKNKHGRDTGVGEVNF